MNGSEVVLTPDSVAALQTSGVSFSEADFTVFLQAYQLDERITDTTMTASSCPLSTNDVPTQGTCIYEDWFLGGIDPFSSIPDIDGSPIPKQDLLCHCK